MSAAARRTAGALLLALVLVAGCSDSPTNVDFQVIEEVTFAPSLGIVLADYTKLQSGVYILDLEVGAGQVITVGQPYSMSYTGWLVSGAQFDSRVAYPFSVYGGGAIQGFELGIEGMQVGGRRRLIIPPALAYGAQGSGPIPPGAIVIFEVELVSVG